MSTQNERRTVRNEGHAPRPREIRAAMRTARIPGKPGYCYGVPSIADLADGESPEPGIWRWANVMRDGQKSQALRCVLPWLPTVSRYIVEKNSKGKIIGARYTLRIDGVEDTIDADDLLNAEEWKRWPGAVGVHDRTVRECLAIVVQAQAQAQEQIHATPYWEGDRLVLPDGDLLARGYGEQADAGEVAELLEIARENPKLALILGLSYAAPYVEPLERQPCWVCPSGDSSKGKTTALLAAASMHGRPGPRGVVRSWNVSLTGVNVLLGQLGVMPAFLDEIHMAGLTPATLKKAVHTTCDGADRMTSSRTRKLRESPPWAGLLFSTGNLSVTGWCPQPEIAVRVLEIPAPIVKDSPTSKRVKQIARRNYGWWSPIPQAEMSRLVEIAEGLLGMPESGGAEERITENLALGVAGAAALGGKPLADSALGAARAMLQIQIDELRDEGRTPAEKLLEELRQAVVARPSRWPSLADYRAWKVDRPGLVIEGFHQDQRVWVLAKCIDSIAQDAGLDNARIALRELRAAGRLVTGTEKDDAGRDRLRKRVRVGTDRFPVYEIDLTSHTDREITGPTGPTGPSADIYAGQGWAEGFDGVGPVTWGAHVPTGPAVPTGPSGTPGGETAGHSAESAPAELELQPPASPSPGGPSETGPTGTVIPLRRPGQRAALADQAANFRRVVEQSAKFGEVPEPELLAALILFSDALDGLSFAGAPARVGQLLFEKLAAQYPRVPTLGPPPAQPVPSGDVVTTFNLLDRTADPSAYAYVVGADVRAQFLGAAGSVDLGTGEAVETSGDWRTVAKKPGYVQLAEAVEVGPGCVVPAGRWLAHPIAVYLDARNGGLPVTAGYHWPQHRRWLNLWATRVRRAREDLMAQDSRPARMALVALKAMYAAFLGGWMNAGPQASNTNRTHTLRPDWMHMVHSTARANMLRALDKASTPPFATLADSAYWLTNDVMEPRGLTFKDQPGKWRIHRLGRAQEQAGIEVAGRLKVTTLAEQIERGSLGNISKVVKALDALHRGTGRDQA